MDVLFTHRIQYQFPVISAANKKIVSDAELLRWSDLNCGVLWKSK